MNDMKQTIIPKSDQLNADDLISGPRTITITGVSIKGGQEQPVAISFDGDDGKPYKACKSMCRVMVMAWGADSKKYIGRSMTLYRDPSVKWGGMEVGGIRISHMSDIDSTLTMALTATRSSRKPFTVKPIDQRAAGAGASQTVSPPVAAAGTATGQPSQTATGASSSTTSMGNAQTAERAGSPPVDEALLVKAREWAETGTEKYANFWAKTLTKEQRTAIGTARHEEYKAIAAKVPA